MLPLNFEDPKAAVIFSESIRLIRGSLMEAANLSPAPTDGAVYVISPIRRVI